MITITDPNKEFKFGITKDDFGLTGETSGTIRNGYGFSEIISGFVEDSKRYYGKLSITNSTPSFKWFIFRFPKTSYIGTEGLHFCFKNQSLIIHTYLDPEGNGAGTRVTACSVGVYDESEVLLKTISIPLTENRNNYSSTTNLSAYLGDYVFGTEATDIVKLSSYASRGSVTVGKCLTSTHNKLANSSANVSGYPVSGYPHVVFTDIGQNGNGYGSYSAKVKVKAYK